MMTFPGSLPAAREIVHIASHILPSFVRMSGVSLWLTRRFRFPLPSYFLGVCQDIKHYNFAVSVIILNADGDRISPMGSVLKSLKPLLFISTSILRSSGGT